MSNVDLHVHSSFSDGVLNPQELIDYFEEAGVSVISITDHNTTEAFFQKLNSENILVIPGVEVDIKHRMDIQFLCYRFDIYNQELQYELQKVRAARMQARVRLIRKLSRSQLFRNLDIRVMYSLKDFHAICAYLAKQIDGYSVTDIQRDFFAEGKPLYYEVPTMQINTCIDLIHSAGGVVLLAHPGRITHNTTALRELFDNLIACGIDGFECYHPDHSSEIEAWIKSYCVQHNCLCSGGSDMHGNQTNYRIPRNRITCFWENYKYEG